MPVLTAESGANHEDGEGSAFKGESVQALRLLGAALVASLLLGAAPSSVPLYGFAPADSVRERGDEARFLDIPSAQGALDAAQRLGARPHYAGTPADRDLAQWTRDQLEAFGFDAHLEEFTARVDTPRKLALELYPNGERYLPRTGVRRAHGTPPIGLDLREVGDPGDPPTLDPSVGLPFVAGSGDGDVVAPLVYVHNGLPDDYAALRHAGVDVRRAVALVRSAGTRPGVLARYAQSAGVAGVILYDDPADDGAGRGPAYPNGPWRPSGSVQRGSLGAGVHIPVLPISADNARVLMRSLRGTLPDGWDGGLGVPYAAGKGPGIVHLVVQLNRTTTALWNTIGVLRGTMPDETVILGAHRDAWVYGVGDDGSGTITLLEAARGLGYLDKGGWRPKRTIVVALWDGEELGLEGSAAFAGTHATDLQRGCVAYLEANEDVTGQRVVASSVGALRASLVDATRVVPDPQRQVQTVGTRWQRQQGGIAIDPPAFADDSALSFFSRFGTPVAALGFEGPFGADHSSYDTVRYAQTWSDPGFALHRTNAQVYGILAMRLADANAIPYTFADELPALRSLLLQLRARALPLEPLAAAIDAYARAARRADDATAHGTSRARGRALDAAQNVDRALSTLRDALQQIHGDGSDSGLPTAVESARLCVERAAFDLR